MTQLISRDDLREAIAAGTVTVVDALGEHYWARQHLPGAIHLVEADVAEKAATLLPDKGAAIVTYCSNTACPNSHQVAVKLGQLGYTNVRRYREGIEDWGAAGLPVESATPSPADS
jgi:rhodanese-related sulfurtransferase